MSNLLKTVKLLQLSDVNGSYGLMHKTEKWTKNQR